MTLGGFLIDANRCPVGDGTIVRIELYYNDTDRVCVASGNWYQDQILNYVRRKVLSYTVNLVDDIATILVEGTLIV